MELRDAAQKFAAAGLKLYAISYDDVEALAAFATANRVTYRLLSDVDSTVIREYGILNTQVDPGDGPIYGIPYPGAYVTDENGVVIEKFFHDSYKKRDSPENLIDAALGRLLLDADAPAARGGNAEVRVTAALHGGGGNLKPGAQRKLVVRFELSDGLHLYGEPVPKGMIPTTVRVEGPPGLVVGEPITPPSQPLRLEAMNVELSVWSGVVDIAVPVYATSELASDCRALERDEARLNVTVRYQACDDETCLLPRTETLHVDVPILPADVPSISMHMGRGQNELPFDGEPHMRRLVLRKL